MSEPVTRDPVPVISFLLAQGSEVRSPERFMAEFGEQLLAAGVPIWRCSTTFFTFDPEILGPQIFWVRGQGTSVILRGHETSRTAAYVGSPVEVVDETGRELRCRLDQPPATIPFPQLRELTALGGTDYLLLPIDLEDAFASSRFVRRQPKGWFSFASDAPGGFDDATLTLLRALAPALSLRMALETTKHAAKSLLTSYLGANAARRVLGGAFRRGTGEAVRAVIWYCDMRGFTAMADTRPARDVVPVLDRYFEAVAAPIGAHGGEVLKFIGDAVLAIFPVVGEDVAGPCGRAIAAARGARANLAALNDERQAAGEPALGLGIALHVGDVMYGNIGARDRLDFTVIGAAVNEACRIEPLTRRLGTDVLLSEAFARDARLEGVVSLGRHELKGVTEAAEVYTLPEG